jgi:hypothetical protein
MRGSSDPSQEKTVRSSTESDRILQLRQGIIRFTQEQAARMTITRRRNPSPSTAGKGPAGIQEARILPSSLLTPDSGVPAYTLYKMVARISFSSGVGGYRVSYRAVSTCRITSPVLVMEILLISWNYVVSSMLYIARIGAVYTYIKAGQ